MSQMDDADIEYELTDWLVVALHTEYLAGGGACRQHTSRIHTENLKWSMVALHAEFPIGWW